MEIEFGDIRSRVLGWKWNEVGDVRSRVLEWKWS
jgi:hypothetical protein